MKIKTLVSFSAPLLVSLLTACNTAPLAQSNQALNSAGQILQQGQQIVGMGQAMQSGGLTGVLMQQLGVSQAQAQGGAGALFQVAKSQMQASAFSQLSQAVPGMGTLLSAAPALQQPSALGGLAGGLSGMGGNSGTMVALASAFQQQGMSPSMVQQFIPVVLQYVQNTGGNGVASALGTALVGQ